MIQNILLHRHGRAGIWGWTRYNGSVMLNICIFNVFPYNSMIHLLQNGSRSWTPRTRKVGMRTCTPTSDTRHTSLRSNTSLSRPNICHFPSLSFHSVFHVLRINRNRFSSSSYYLCQCTATPDYGKEGSYYNSFPAGHADNYS